MSGSLSMAKHLLFELENAVGTIFGTVTAIDTNHGFIGFIVPKDRIQNAGVPTMSTTDAFGEIEANATRFFGNQSIGGTDFGTGRIRAGSTHDHDKASFHAADRFDMDTGFCQTCFIYASGTGKHATLAAYASFVVHNG